MGDSAKTPGDWKTERISMTHLANFSRSSSYVRSLVRQQFNIKSDQPSNAWERLRERLEKTSSFDYEEETPSFLKKRERRFDSEENSDEDEDDEEETYRSSTTIGHSKTKSSNEENASSHEHASASSSRRLLVPQSPGGRSDADKQYTLASVDAHSKILNRRLSLAENVIKNYSKYIRTPDELQLERTTSARESEREKTKKPLLIAAISEEESSPRVEMKPPVAISEVQTSPAVNIKPTGAISEKESSLFRNVKLVNRYSPALTPRSNFLAIPADISFVGSCKVPPSPAAETAGTTFSFDVAPVRRKSFSGITSLTRSVTDVTSVSTKEKVASDASKLPRLSATQLTSKAKRKKLSANSRDEAIQKLRGDYEKLTKNKRLNRRVGQNKKTFYQQLQQDRERRAKESEIFYQEMEQITKSLKAINNRLDERLKILDCADPQKARYKRILQIALAGLPFNKI